MLVYHSYLAFIISSALQILLTADLLYHASAAVETPRQCGFFTARRYASAVLAVIVCLSVRLSQVGVVQRWLNLGSD